MSFLDRFKKSPTSKPVILCDVGGTLLNPTNKPLIQLINRAQTMGFDVQICTGAIDEDDGDSIKKDMKEAGVSDDIIARARGKEGITESTFSGVVAIIDDSIYADYIRRVQQGNPKAQFFEPNDTEKLRAHLNSIKKGSPQLG